MVAEVTVLPVPGGPCDGKGTAWYNQSSLLNGTTTPQRVNKFLLQDLTAQSFSESLAIFTT